MDGYDIMNPIRVRVANLLKAAVSAAAAISRFVPVLRPSDRLPKRITPP